MSKLIGISTGIKDVQMAPGNIPSVVINNDFINLCNKFGNTAIVIGPQNDNLEIDAAKFDALIISGGGDINPTPGVECRTRPIQSLTLCPGNCPPSPGLAP